MKTSFTPSSWWQRLCPLWLLGLLLIGSSAGAQTNLLTEGFENSTFPPTGWSRAVIVNTVNWESNSGGTGTPAGVSPHSGSRMTSYNCFGATRGSIAELRTPSLDFSGSGSKVLSFWFYKVAYSYPSTGNSDNIDVLVNTAPTAVGATPMAKLYNYILRPPMAAAAGWYKYSFVVPAAYNGTSNYIIFKANSFFGPNFFVDDVSIDAYPPCTGRDTAGVVTPAGPLTLCPGSTLALQSTNYGLNGNALYNWQYSTNGGTTWINAAGAGANTPVWTSFPVYQNTRFRFYNTCLNTGDTSFSNVVIANVSGGGSFPQYASLPFSESFESWTNGCSSSDLPSLNWTNIPASGNNSFRRHDQGASASWTNVANGLYSPVSRVGSYSARLHTNSAGSSMNKGQLSCYVDCSAPGAKELEFYLLSSPVATYNDSTYVEYSTDGGMSWSLLARYGPGTGGWDYKNLTLNSNSATTVVRWTMWQEYGFTGYTDMGLDGVRILPPCSAAPVAGTIDSVDACPGKNFRLSLSGTSAAAGLSYQWFFRPTGSTLPWAPLAGGNVPAPTANISVPTSFKVYVGCSNLTPSPLDSAFFDVKLLPFYYCYCNTPTSVNFPTSHYQSIGEVKIEKFPSLAPLMSNPSGYGPGYTSYQRTVAPPTLVRDSFYRFSLFSIGGANGYINSTAAPAVFFLDWNRNGLWDLPQERIMGKSSGSASGNWVFQNYQIPSNAAVGLTGLRAMHGYNLGNGSAATVDPCGSFYYASEAEDYLVYIEYQPCSGPVTAGTSYISDTIVCPGYTVDLWNTTYEQQRTGIARMWEISTDGGFNWTALAGGANKDTLLNVVVPPSSFGIKYRLRVICSNTSDTSASNSVTVSNPPASSCYPFASALPPGAADSSDIGSFEIASYTNPAPMKVSGPHLGNPLANRRRTDYTGFGPMTLAADSTYRLAIYHTMRSMHHADALVSVFIDFNNDGLYTVSSPGHPFPPELIYQGRTTASDFYLDTSFKMPSTLIGGLSTGLRVVLNNDLNPAAPGNTGIGGFTSGEVEDYVVYLSRVNLGTGGPGMLKNVAVYPNPTEGKTRIVFDASKNIGPLRLVLSTPSGQQVMHRSYDDPGTHFATELDMSGLARGIYLLELQAGAEKSFQKLILR